MKEFVVDEPQSIVGMTIAEVRSFDGSVYLHFNDGKSIVIISPVVYQGHPAIKMAMATLAEQTLQ